MRGFMTLVTALALCGNTLHAQERLDLDYRALAAMVVSRLALEPGERVLLLAHPDAFRGMVPPLRHEVAKAGGIDLGALEVMPTLFASSWDPELQRRSFEQSRAAYRDMFEHVDAAVILPGVAYDPAYAAALYDAVDGTLAVQ